MAWVPTVWVLLGKKLGDNRQLLSLAAALGWPYETKNIAYNRWQRCPNLLLGASTLSLDRRRSSPLLPPWPDLVIAGSRRSAPIARWIKRQSGDATRLVHLMHTQAPLAPFDLVVTTPQYRLPILPNVLHNTGPMNLGSRERLAQAATLWEPRLRHLPRPWLALLVGGDSASYRLDVATARRLGHEVSARLRARGGSLLLTTSARTPAAAADALLDAIECSAFCYRWRASDPDNPYAAFLALADQFVVTIDSASLVAEACATGRPVEIFRWPRRVRTGRGPLGLLQRAVEERGQADGGGPRPLLRLYERLVYLGLVKPTRDFEAFVGGLRTRGLVCDWNQPATAPRRPLDDVERAVARIREIIAAPPADARGVG